MRSSSLPEKSLSAAPVAKSQRAFTLIELMIVVAIVAILAAIAMPSYNNYIIKSEIRTAQSELLALSLQFENRYQRTLAYPAITANNAAAVTTAFQTWKPSSINFTFTASASSATAYTVVATGVDRSRQAGCTITLTHTNTRTTSGCKYTTGTNWL